MKVRVEGKTLLIRADAGIGVGHGHVMRMLALAQAWLRSGGQVTFQCVTCPDTLCERLQREGCVLSRSSEIDVASPDDAAQTALTAQRAGAGVIVLDGYGFDAAFVQGLRSKVQIPLVCVVDAEPSEQLRSLAQGVLYPCFGASDAPQDEGVRLWKGRDYVLIRQEFLDASLPEFPERGPEERSLRLLVCMGGSDPCNASGAVLRALAGFGIQPGASAELALRVVVGASNAHLESLNTHLAALPERWTCELCVDVRDMPAQLRWADAAITAVGGTVWECLLFGMPLAVVAIAENQRALQRDLVDASRATGLGDLSRDRAALDAPALQRWLEDVSGSRGRRRQKPPIDGLGARRIAERLARLV